MNCAATRIECDSCVAAMINGTFCHEAGCPNSRKVFVDGRWVRMVTCYYCGYEVEEGESCDCQAEWEVA